MARKKEMCSSKSNEPGAGIVLLKLEELHSFEGHPFKVERNQELFELRCSIEKEGVLVPLLVRKNPHGDGYEIISGHRRKEAALWTGLTKVPVIIRELDDDQSVIAMIDSNLQREKILPSEKAFAYKMRLEAMKHQGRLESDTSDPLEPRYKTKLVNVSELEAEIQKLGKVKIQQKDGAGGKRSNEQLASMVGESVTQIKRYIRLTHLIPKIWDMVDKEILAIRSAVSSLFAGEWHDNTSALVLTTRNGWGKIALAKILTGLAFTVELFALLAVSSVISQLLFMGTAGWDMPIQNIKLIAVAPMNMLQAEIYEYAFVLLGAIGFAGIVMFISAAVKNNVLALLLSLAVVYGPMMIAEYLPYGMQKALDLIPLVGSSTDIFRTNTFRILGKLIWSPYLLITIPVLIGILCMPFAIKSWSRRMKA